MTWPAELDARLLVNGPDGDWPLITTLALGTGCEVSPATRVSAVPAAMDGGNVGVGGVVGVFVPPPQARSATSIAAPAVLFALCINARLGSGHRVRLAGATVKRPRGILSTRHSARSKQQGPCRVPGLGPLHDRQAAGQSAPSLRGSRATGQGSAQTFTSSPIASAPAAALTRQASQPAAWRAAGWRYPPIRSRRRAATRTTPRVTGRIGPFNAPARIRRGTSRPAIRQA